MDAEYGTRGTGRLGQRGVWGWVVELGTIGRLGIEGGNQAGVRKI